MTPETDPDLERLRRIVRDAKKKPNRNGHAAPGEQPTILVEPGERNRAADQALDAMQAAATPFFRRYSELVRICHIEGKAADGAKVFTPSVAPVATTTLQRALAHAADWQKPKGKKLVAIDPPEAVAKQILSMIEEWPFPPLRGIIATPTLRPDGSLLTRPGYDQETGLYLFNPPAMPAIPEQPTLRDADKALSLLNDLLAEFAFIQDDGVSRAAAIAMLMTPVLRGAMECAPMFVTTKPEAGTGGSYLADLAAMIATGERAPVLSLSTNPEENEKRLGGAALLAQPIIALDNVSIDLGGDFLCQLTERPRPQVRRLGSSDLVTIDNSFTVFANGNQLQTTGDLVRRTIQIELDANMEDPDRRQFSRKPLAEIKADRGRYVAAILTIARAYAAAGYPDELPPRPSYEDWSRTVRSALTWLNWPDPVLSVEKLRAADPVRSARAIVFDAWINHLSTNDLYTTSEIIDYARDAARKELWDAITDVARARNTPEPDPTRLGQWLNKNLNTVAHSHKLTVDRGNKKRPRWKLTPIQ